MKLKIPCTHQRITQTFNWTKKTVLECWQKKCSSKPYCCLFLLRWHFLNTAATMINKRIELYNTLIQIPIYTMQIK